MTPTQDQVMVQLRILIPAVATAATAFGVSQTDAGSYAQMAMASIAPISYVIVALWGWASSTRASLIRRAAATTPSPQIILPPQDKALADKLPENVTAAPHG